MNREGCGKKGIRDVLEHDSSSVAIMREKTSRGPWHTRAMLHDVSESGPMTLDLLLFVEEHVGGLCALWTQLHKILPLPDGWKGYKAGANLREGDFHFVLGDDVDVTRLWPPI